MMENLVPREVYDVDETGYRERLGIISGILFGLPWQSFFSNDFESRVWLACFPKHLPRNIVWSRLWKGVPKALSEENVFDA
jgi:hypothetical protein